MKNTKQIVDALRELGLKPERRPLGIYVEDLGSTAETTIKRIAFSYDARCQFTRDFVRRPQDVLIISK